MTRPPQSNPVQIPTADHQASEAQESHEQNVQQSATPDFREGTIPPRLNDLANRLPNNAGPEVSGGEATGRFSNVTVDDQQRGRLSSPEAIVPANSQSSTGNVDARSANPYKHFMSADDKKILSILSPFGDGEVQRKVAFKPGNVVDDQVKLTDLPAEVVAIVPYLSDLMFFTAGQDAFLVNPVTRRILKKYYGRAPDLAVHAESEP